MTLREYVQNNFEEPYRTQILENVRQQNGDQYENGECDNVSPASVLEESFLWFNTSQGDKYWYDYYTKLEGELREKQEIDITPTKDGE